MSCKLDLATEVKEDILDCDENVRHEIGEFLLALQQNPLPQNREHMGKGDYYVELPCGFYVAWEILGDQLHLALTGDTTGVVVRILGVSRVQPAALKSGWRKERR